MHVKWLFLLINQPVFFVSEELEKERIRYYNYLNGVRGKNADWFSWIDFFLDASQRMTDNMLRKLEATTILANVGIDKINSSNATINRIWFSTFNKPYVTVSEVAEQLNISVTTARNGLNRLVALKLIDVDHAKRKNKVYVNYDLLRVLG